MIKIFLRVVLIYFLQVVSFLILARALLSWVFAGNSNSIYEFICYVTEPILEPFRRLLEKFNLGGYVDFSPILAILAIEVIINIL